jgi:hypothetical protein
MLTYSFQTQKHQAIRSALFHGDVGFLTMLKVGVIFTVQPGYFLVSPVLVTHGHRVRRQIFTTLTGLPAFSPALCDSSGYYIWQRHENTP